jgi:hypothetical protein
LVVNCSGLAKVTFKIISIREYFEVCFWLYRSFCVSRNIRLPFTPQEKRFNVRRRFPRTERTQIAIAADSFAAAVGLVPLRTFTVLRTFLIHRQKCFAKDVLLMCFCVRRRKTSVLLEEMDINRMTSTKDDLCAVQQYFQQSVGPGRYYTTNLVPDAREVNPLAASAVTTYPREGYGYNNKQIDADSVLRNQSAFQSHKCFIRAQSRPFLSVPFMGGGRGNPDVESVLQQSEQVRMGSECGTVTEQQLNVFDPLIPSVAANIQKPSNLIPEVAQSGWIRGGIPSRQYIRDINC